MPRYTDIDKLIAEYDRVHVGPAGGARKLMVEAPIADVAPRAEVAREIFEEIITTVFSKMPPDVLMVGRDCDFTDGIRMGKREAIIDMINTLAELKKKYAEEKK